MQNKKALKVFLKEYGFKYKKVVDDENGSEDIEKIQLFEEIVSKPEKDYDVEIRVLTDGHKEIMALDEDDEHQRQCVEITNATYVIEAKLHIDSNDWIEVKKLNIIATEDADGEDIVSELEVLF